MELTCPLLNDGWRERGQVEGVAPIERQFIGFALVDDHAERCRFRADERRPGGHGDFLALAPDFQRKVDLQRTFHLQIDRFAGGSLEALLADRNAISIR